MCKCKASDQMKCWRRFSISHFPYINKKWKWSIAYVPCIRLPTESSYSQKLLICTSKSGDSSSSAFLIHIFYRSVWYMCKRIHSIIGWLSKMLRYSFSFEWLPHPIERSVSCFSLYIIFNSSINLWLLIADIHVLPLETLLSFSFNILSMLLTDFEMIIWLIDSSV